MIIALDEINKYGSVHVRQAARVAAWVAAKRSEAPGTRQWLLIPEPSWINSLGYRLCFALGVFVRSLRQLGTRRPLLGGASQQSIGRLACGSRPPPRRLPLVLGLEGFPITWHTPLDPWTSNAGLLPAAWASSPFQLLGLLPPFNLWGSRSEHPDWVRAVGSRLGRREQDNVKGMDGGKDTHAKPLGHLVILPCHCCWVSSLAAPSSAASRALPTSWLLQRASFCGLIHPIRP